MSTYYKKKGIIFGYARHMYLQRLNSCHVYLSINIAVSCFVLHRVQFQFSFGQIQETKDLNGLLRSFEAIKLSLNRVTQFVKVGSLCYFLSNIDHSTLTLTLPQTLATLQPISL